MILLPQARLKKIKEEHDAPIRNYRHFHHRIKILASTNDPNADRIDKLLVGRIFFAKIITVLRRNLGSVQKRRK